MQIQVSLVLSFLETYSDLTTLLPYLRGQLKAKCPFFLHVAQVASDIHSGIEGGQFLGNLCRIKFKSSKERSTPFFVEFMMLHIDE